MLICVINIINSIIIFSRGTPQATRQAGNFIQSLIDDPDCNVAEILPASTLTIPATTTALPLPISASKSVITNTKASSPPKPNLDSSLEIPKTDLISRGGASSLSKSLNTPKSSKVPPPAVRQISAPATFAQQQGLATLNRKTNTMSSHSRRSETTTVFTTRESMADHMSTPSRMSRITNDVSSTNGVSWKKEGGIVGKQNDVSHTPLATAQRQTITTTSVLVSSQSVEVTRRLSNEINNIHKIITTINTTIFSSSTNTSGSTADRSSLPKPIGSNRPFRALTSPTNALSSTAVSNSVAATLHSTLNSLLSQVATQRSPMIWNEHPGSKEQHAGGDLVVTTVATSPNNILNGTPMDRFLPASLSHASSQESFKGGHSRTPSLSPSSNHSTSPPPPPPPQPVVQPVQQQLPPPDEKPHLNPIGSERGHKKPSSHSQPGSLQGLSSFLQGIFVFNIVDFVCLKTITILTIFGCFVVFSFILSFIWLFWCVSNISAY